MIIKYYRQGLAIFFMCLVTSFCFAADTLLRINDIQVRSVDANTTDIKLIFADVPKLHYFTLDNPTRVVIDVDN